MAGGESTQAMMCDPNWFEHSNPKRFHRLCLCSFTQCIGFQIHVFTGIGKNGREWIADSHRHFVFHQCQNPVKIAKVVPMRIEKNASFMNDAASDKNGACQDRKTVMNALGMRRHRMAVTNVSAVAINDDCAGKHNFNLGMILKKIAYRFERTGQVLFIAIQVCENIALRTAITTIDGVIHAAVLFNERPNAFVVWQPVLGAVVRTGILHDVLKFNPLLVGDGRDAELEPV
jgi:hypothetical protein